MSTGADDLTIETASVEETLSLGEFVAGELSSGVLALDGELGSGKTVFVKGLARGLGIRDDVASPTFVIEQAYEGRVRLRHIDAYRLAGPEELSQAGVSAEAEGELVAVEWAGRVLAALPEERLEVHFEHAGETSRRITFRDPSRAYEGIMRGLFGWRGDS